MYKRQPQGLGQVGHLVKGGYAPVEPLEHLPGPEGRLPQLLEVGGHLRQVHGFDVGHGSSPLPCTPGGSRPYFFATAASRSGVTVFASGTDVYKRQP